MKKIVMFLSVITLIGCSKNNSPESIYFVCNNKINIIEYDINGKKTYNSYESLDSYELLDTKVGENKDVDSRGKETHWVLMTPRGGLYTDKSGSENNKKEGWTTSVLNVTDKFIRYEMSGEDKYEVRQGGETPIKEKNEHFKSLGISRISGRLGGEMNNTTRYPDGRWTSTRILTNGMCEKGFQKF